MHFLIGAVAVANLPALHRRFGVAATTKAGALALAGAGIGNATSLPPVIAQAEFAEADVARVVALVVAVAQGVYAFAPAAFGLIRDLAPHAPAMHPGAAPCLFAAAGLVQALAIAALLAGRRR